MKQFKYDEFNNNMICSHEDSMFVLYQNIVKEYEPKFGEYGLTLKCSIFWHNFLKQQTSSVRLPFINGYSCGFTVGLEKNGEIICYDEEEGATLGANFSISSISRFFFHLNVTLWSDTDEIHEEMFRLINIVESL